MERYCEICGGPLTTERHLCKECQKAKKRQYARAHYKEQREAGVVKVRYGVAKCSMCGSEFVRNKPDQCLCYECYKSNTHKTVDDYNKVPRSHKGHTIGRQTILNLGIKLAKNTCVHHLDENPENNDLENLVVLNRKSHASLHRFLEKKWLDLIKENKIDLNDCWNSIRSELTATWLKSMKVEVININEFNKSSIEILNEDVIYIFSK